MGNQNSTPDLVDSSILDNENIFKVDNINSHGSKHSSAKIQLSPDNLCIHQKHRQSLFIPLDTIKRYGLDGSIFILECGRRAPLGQARYAFRCKQARRLVDCLDQRIATISNQLSNDQQDENSLSLTNVSSMFNNLRQTQSSTSLSSATSFYRNSEPNLSENYFAFRRDNQEHPNLVEMNYAEFNTESQKSNSSVETQKSNVISPTNQNGTTAIAAFGPGSSTTKSYVYIDHEKTTTLKEIATERLQQHPRRADAS